METAIVVDLTNSEESDFGKSPVSNCSSDEKNPKSISPKRDSEVPVSEETLLPKNSSKGDENAEAEGKSSGDSHETLENDEKSEKNDKIIADDESPEEITNVEKIKTAESYTEMPLTSLAFLAMAYDNSDSDSDEPLCVYEQRNVEVNEKTIEPPISAEYRSGRRIETSDEESEDDSGESEKSSSSGAESEDSEEEKKSGDKKKNERRRRNAGIEKETKGEYDDLPPIEDLKISVPEVLCDPLGEVGWMVEQMVIVKPKSGKPTLNLDTILFVERGRRVLGRIFDVFGQVSEPHYCVRFNSTDHIEKSDIKVGMIVYFCPNTEYTSVVFMHDLLKMKATDDIGDDENPQFSDDEEEQAYFAALRQKQKGERAKSSEVPQKRQRTDGQDPSWRSKHPWNSGRRQRQPEKFGNNGKSGEWKIGQQQNSGNTANLWQRSSSYVNDQWTESEGYQAWQRNSQNSNSYNESVENCSRADNSRGFFRPPQIIFPGQPRYAQNPSYQFHPNSPRFPVPNFSWQSQAPPRFPWFLPPPPPPPPGI